MPSVVFGASPALPPTALPDDESGLNTEWLTARVGCAGDVALPTFAVSATPCSCSPLHLIFIRPSRHSSVDLHHTERKNVSASVHSAGSSLPDSNTYIRLSGGGQFQLFIICTSIGFVGYAISVCQTFCVSKGSRGSMFILQFST